MNKVTQAPRDSLAVVVPVALFAFLTTSIWYLPVLAPPSYAYLIPFFHSLKYLAFVWSFKGNQVAARLQGHKLKVQREIWARDFIGYAITVVLLGALAFEFVPKFLDSQNYLRSPELGRSPFLAAFLLFINIHHYFIDNVIWKSSNAEVKKYLFASPVATADQKPILKAS